MSKFLLTLLMGLLLFSLSACTNDEGKETSKTEKTLEKQDGNETVNAEELQTKLDEQMVNEDSVVAVVNGQELKGSEYNDALSISQIQFQQMGQDITSTEVTNQLKEYTLNSLIGQTLLMQEINKKGYKASNEEIDKELEGLKKQYKDQEEFEEAMKKNNLTLDKLRGQIAETIKYSQYIKNDLNVEDVTEEDVKNYYESYAEGAGEETPKFEDVKEILKAQLKQQKTQEKLSAKVEELKKTADIELKI